ncbi:trypsin [Aedes aegypti]|uniref:Peptidase S1 domain-containing protein n=2 Tax=Aedes aegypti TaxID=7159 RepID=A0A903TNM3_AEDAE|nr:trypsin [Aedes aegypti]
MPAKVISSLVSSLLCFHLIAFSWQLENSESGDSSTRQNCPTCACGGMSSDSRIIGGNQSNISAYPWMAALYYQGQFTCGGSLINDRYILTAAHCVARSSAKQFEVFLRRINIRGSNPEMLQRKVESITLNHYQGGRINNDVALLRLTEPVSIEPNLVPICLPEGSDSYVGREAMLIGWGTTADGDLSDTLQQLTVPIMSNQECKRSGYFRFQITNRMMCAGYLDGGRDSCQGDSGGPLQLVNPSTGRHEIVGVVSWGKECAQRNYPGVYARVTKFVAWARSNSRDACWCQ